MLLELDDSLKFKTHNYQSVLTHDVDAPLKYTSFKSELREIAGDIIKRKDIKLAYKNVLQKVKTTLGIQKDPFDNMYYSGNKFIKKLVNKIKKEVII